MISDLDFRWFDFDYTDLSWIFLILLFAIPVTLLVIRQESVRNKIVFTSVPERKYSGLGGFIRIAMLVMRYAAILFLIVAMIRPQMLAEQKIISHYTGGIDIVISLDISGSMLSEDFSPNRLEVAKSVAIDFIKGRSADRIGLVVYEGHALTKCPLTTDHALLIHQFEQLKSGMISEGTAVGTGLAVAVNRLRESDAKSKVIILITDGESNAGNIDPETAAELAREFNIKVYCIGVGSYGEAFRPQQDPFGRVIRTSFAVDIDEKTLTSVANMTGGKYFRAKDENSLRSIYDEIDKLEKSDVKVKEYKSDPPEKFHSFAFIALLLLAIEFILRTTLFKSIF
jgi:Ca-activated chloride channel homolog